MLIALFASVSWARAQQIEYGVRFDSVHMLIGDHQNLTFMVRSDIPLSLKFPVLEGEIGGMEIVSGPVSDSVKEDNKYIYSQVYKVTAFDTGIYVIPPQSILIAQEGYDNAMTTDSIMIAVNTLVIDNEKGIVDIEAPLPNPVTFREALPYIIIILIGLAFISGATYIIIRLLNGKPIMPVRKMVPVPPYDVAVRAIQQLDESGLWQAGNEKRFYSELTDILREYLDGELDLACMESTTPQIIRYLSYSDKVDERSREFISDMLQCADLVKFAKMMPLQDENRNYLKGTMTVIDKIHANFVIPAEGDQNPTQEESEHNVDKESKEVENV